MASRIRFNSIHFQGLLISTLWLSLSFSACNATSRSTETMARADRMATSCRGRDCSTANMEQDHHGVMHSKLAHMSSTDSDAAEAQISDSRMSGHDNSEWVRGSEPMGIMGTERLRDSGMVREDQTIRDSDRMRGQNWMRDPANKMSAMEKMRDNESERSNMDSTRGGDSNRLRNSERMSSDYMESQRLDNTHRMRDSDGMMNRMGDLHGMSDSDRITDSERMRESQVTIDSDRMRDSHGMIHSDRMRDSHGMIDSDEMRDSQRMIDSDRMRDKHGMIDSDGMRESHWMMESDRIGDSHQMTDSNTMRDSENHMKNSERWSADLEGANDRESEMMQDVDRTKVSEGKRDLEKTMMDSAAAEGRTHLDGGEEHRSGMMGDSAHEMSNLNSRRRDSDMMRNSDSMQEGSERMNTYSLDGMSHFGAENPRMGHMVRQQSSTMEPRSCHETNCHSTSDLMGDAEQMESSNNRRGNLEKMRGSDGMRNSDNMREGSEPMSTNSHRMKNSHAADHSRMGDMAKQHSSTMEPSSCHGTNCPGSTIDAEAMQLTSRRLDAEIIGSQPNMNSERMDSSTAAERCSGMHAADCDAALDGEIRGSKKMNHMSEREGLSSPCRFNGADCHVTPDGELQGSQKMDHTSEKEGLPSSCTFNGADCHVTPDRETSNTQPTRSGRVTSCSDDHCRQSIANSDETMARMANSERMHRTRNDREIVSSPKWMNLERGTATITDTTRMVNSKKTSPMSNQHMTRSDSQQMRSTDSETMQAHRDRHLGSNIDDAGKRSPRMGGSEMAHDSNANHWSSNGEINHPTSCTNEANCQLTSGIIHASSRNSEMMGHGAELEMTHSGSKKSLENRDLTNMDQMSNSADMISDSEMMRNSEAANADNLPIQGRN